MFIRKIFNNNVILAKNANEKEIVLMGCGLAFGKKVGEEVDESKIEKTFILDSKDVSEKFELILEDVPMEHIAISHDIIEYAKNILGEKLNDYIYVTLTDHISYCIKQCAKNINKPNKLIWEIKKFYPKEFNVGLKALELIESETGYSLNEDEAGNIALHLINAQVSNGTDGVEDVYNMTKKIEDILNIVKYTYNIELSEKSLNYERFVTHLRFFFKRLEKKQIIDSDDDFLFEQVQVKYEQAFKCMLKIQKYLGTELSKEEQVYLTLHIQRVTQR